ncbi:MAG TPA: DinB family protein [Phycisphaerae bacterium]|nr:DinB family protein [Phycisphaerae bacterium]
MIHRTLLDELLAHSDWARDQLLARAADLDAAALDRPFEMGEGSLRATLRHLWGAERVWLCRWQGADFTPYLDDLKNAALPIPRLAELWRATGTERAGFLSGLADSALAGDVTYTDLRGQTHTYPLGGLLLHVCNHGIHHRAQALNMLRHVQAQPLEPGIDYIFTWRDRVDKTPPRVRVESLRDYFAYNDWAQQQVLAAADGLTDAQLDRTFAMGEGTLRGTLLHIRFAEQWWQENWTFGPGKPFPEMPPATPFAEIRRLVDETARARRAYLATLSDADLLRSIEVHPMPDVVRHFPLAVTMIQVCHHGTHHRAQALNMLRHLGAPVPQLDYLRMLQAQTSA